MAYKTKLTDREKQGLTQEETKLAEKYLRKHRTAGIVDEVNSLKLFELFLIGSSFRELHVQFPRYNLGQIILTGAMRGWVHDRENMMHSLKDRVKAKVVKSILEQVDFLTSMLGVSNAQYLDNMRQYIADPVNTPAPSLRIESIKEYKDVVETLQKLMAGSTPGAKTPSLLDAVSEENNKKLPKQQKEEKKEKSAAALIQAQLVDDEE